MNIKCTTSHNKDIRLKLSEAIASAKISIQIVCFEVSSKDIINLLMQKSNDGVAVKIICEERKAGRELIKLGRKNNSNLDITFSNPNEYYYALHEKLILIDDSVALFGSFNLSDTSLNENIELLFETREQRLVQHIKKQISFVEQVLNSNQSRHNKKLSNTVRGKGTGFMFENKEENHLVFSNEYCLHHLISDFLSKVKTSITIYASHHISKELLDSLLSASRGNVRVNIVVDRSALKKVLIHKKVTNLVRYVSVRGKMHIKAILIDSDIYLVGSANLFERSLFQDQEFMLIGRDPELNKVIRDHLEIVFNKSRPLSFAFLWSLRIKHYKSKAQKLLKKMLKAQTNKTS